MLGYTNFRWKNDKLMLGSRNTGAKIIPDSKWPNMYRVEFPPGVISDMANLTRAKDAAVCLVASYLNNRTVEFASTEAATEYLLPIEPSLAPTAPPSALSTSSQLPPPQISLTITSSLAA